MARSKTNSIVSPVVKGTIKVAQSTETLPKAKRAGKGLYFLEENGTLGFRESEDHFIDRIEGIRAYYRVEFRYSSSVIGDPTALVAFFDKDGLILGYTPLRSKVIHTLPTGTVRIDFSDSIKVAGKYKHSLIVIDLIAHDVTLDIMNWADAYGKYDRIDLQPVYKQIDFPLQFIGGTMTLLRDLIVTDGLYAEVYFELWQRTNHAPHNYSLAKRTRLDFASYEDHTDHVEITMRDDTLRATVNSFKSVDYDIPVAALRPANWQYNRMDMASTGRWTMPEKNYNKEHAYIKTIKPFINLDGSELVHGGMENDFLTQKVVYNSTTTEHFFEAARFVSVKVKVKVKFTGRTSSINKEGKTDIVLAKILVNADGEPTGTESIKTIEVSYNDEDYVFSVDTFVDMSRGEKLTLYFTYPATPAGMPVIHYNLAVKEFEYLSVEYMDRAETSLDIPVIDPVNLAQKLIDNMCGVAGKYACEIHWKQKPFKTMIVAAESIRGLNKAYIHTKYQDFAEWMNFLGYEVDYEDDKVIWRERDYWFKKNTTALEIADSEVAGLMVSVDSKYSWTSLKVGYDRASHDNANGRYDPMGTYSYESTWLRIGNEDSTHEIISPYRADAIGIEILAWSRGKKTTDGSSDNDIFFVAVVVNSWGGGNLVEYVAQTIISTLEDIPGVAIVSFNAPFNPRFILEENASMIGIGCQRLIFTGTDGCRQIAMSGASPVAIFEDFVPSKQLFKPLQYGFSHGSHLQMPQGSARHGVVRFKWHGEWHSGFINRMAKNYFDERTDSDWVVDVVD